MKSSFAELTLLLFISLLFSGCWGAHEINTLAFVMGLGLDEAREPDEINLIVQNSVEEKNETTFQILETRSENLLHAFDLLNQKSSRLLYMSQNQALIFGRKLAEKGVKNHVDYFLRDDQTRMEVLVFVAEGKAKQILAAEIKPELNSALALVEMMRQESRRLDVYDLNLLNFTSSLLARPSFPLAPLIKVIEENGKKKLAIAGLAVFRGDKMIGRLDRRQAFGYALGMGKVRGGSLNAFTKKGMAVLNIVDLDCRRRPILKADGEIELAVKISGRFTVGEMQGFDGMQMRKVFPLLENAAGWEIKRLILESFAVSQQMNADIFGCGLSIQRAFPDAWRTMVRRWEKLYPSVKLSLDVDVKLKNAGKIVNSLDMKEQRR